MVQFKGYKNKEASAELKAMVQAKLDEFNQLNTFEDYLKAFKRCLTVISGNIIVFIHRSHMFINNSPIFIYLNFTFYLLYFYLIY